MPNFVRLPFVSTVDKPSVISDGFLFARGINWGESGTERGQAYRTQNVYIATLTMGDVYLGCFSYTEQQFPAVTCRTIIISNNPFSCIIAPEIYNDYSTFNLNETQDGIYFNLINTHQSTSGTTLFSSASEAINAFKTEYGSYPITYRLTNCTSPTAPQRANIGDTVNVDLVFPQGYGIVNPSTDVYVTNNGVTVQSSYVNGRLTFTMPNPNQSG